MKLTRFGVSMERELVERLDALVGEQGYANRSEAIRSLIRRELVRQDAGAGEQPTDVTPPDTTPVNTAAVAVVMAAPGAMVPSPDHERPQTVLSPGDSGSSRRPELHTVDKPVAGIVSLLYRYGTQIIRRSTAPYPGLTINANLQLHLGNRVCLKTIIVQGPCDQVRGWALPLVHQKKVVGELRMVSSAEMKRIFDGGEAISE